ncbi:PREDICTED: trypsin-like [Rhagoletis zephyria]|uniref:trypsin-like n=1 Tax=Rhagoletis zephyria TaxID=28612 RepID=UPI000811885F|nr:PREDICTED: trypsin-like [Rhagoletis zephyria]
MDVICQYYYALKLHSETPWLSCTGVNLKSPPIKQPPDPCRAFYCNKFKYDSAYDIETNENDIAIVKLAEAASVSSYLGLASSLPSSGVLVSWDESNAVVQVSETITSAKVCVTQGYKYEDGDLYNSQFCGLAANEACGELPGSPLVADNKLLGVVSWGYGCGNKDSPAVYSNIPVLKLWIESVL